MDDAGVARSFATTLGLFVAVAAVALPVTVWRLRRYHSAEWEKLATAAAGRPAAAVVVAWRLVRFIVSQRHFKLDDLTLSLASLALTLGVLAVIVGFLGWMQSLSAAG
jgi:hypothetical protein